MSPFEIEKQLADVALEHIRRRRRFLKWWSVVRLGLRWCVYAAIAAIVILSLSDFGLGKAVGSLLIGAIYLLIGAIYLLPAVIADYRHHRNRRAIMALNILLGWTFLGWVIALVWSLTADTEIGPTDSMFFRWPT